MPLPSVSLMTLFETVRFSRGVHAVPAPPTPLPPAMPLPLPKSAVWLASIWLPLTTPAISEKPLLPIRITVPMLLLPSGFATVPLFNISKLIWVRALALALVLATVIACVALVPTPVSSVIRLLVIEMMWLGSLTGRPEPSIVTNPACVTAAAPDAPALPLPIEIWMPLPPLPLILLLLMSASFRLNAVVAVPVVLKLTPLKPGLVIVLFDMLALVTVPASDST